MRFLSGAAVVAAAALAGAADNAPSSTTAAPACTATSSTGSGAFFDLRPDMAARPEKGQSHKAAVTKDYRAKGYDYGKNFTLNVCGAVVDPVTDVVGIDRNLWANVSAYYMSHGSIYSIGSQSLDLRSRGRKLVLQYTGGSPCGGAKSKSRRSPEIIGGDGGKTGRKKSTTISFLCDRDPGNTQAAISFVGTDPDECAYFFEARSPHACAHAEPHKPGSVGPGSVFGIIFLIAVLVYVLGGVFYNRAITNARGWRQLPNYSLWAGIWNFVSDVFVILWSWCARLLPSRRGYSYLNSNASSRHRNSDAENRLIDQLDEEWDD
ncbi:hypothetical protein HIM_05677 [Hirsutella minnesotensis 3608]|uniref:MRH domain-containing protein n=1 Tax=Hirsutella minnesotensis 3608 TaxID=1043627 RepID=A0A0F7ZK36_9HYPO|nr:hypothetical protein HIM_05677 [Hirsutella minnesotensis 3608]